MIPHSLCLEFQQKVAQPWQQAWKTFRSSRQRSGREDLRQHSDRRKDEFVGAESSILGHARRAQIFAEDTASSNAIQDLPGDAVFLWGCLDWHTSNMSNVGKKGNSRSGFVVSVPDLLALPPSLANEVIVQIAAGARHNLILTQRGEVFAWGRGILGQLGCVATGCTSHPLHLRALALGQHHVTSISCGAEHSCLVLRTGELLAFGSGKRGQTGLGTSEVIPLPQRMQWSKRLAQHAAAVSCGAFHTAAILIDGTLLTCGASDNGMLGHGNGNGETDSRIADVFELSAVHMLTALKMPTAAVSAGGAHTLAVTRQNGLYAFGAGSWGRLGLGASDNRDRAVPTRVRAAEHLGVILQLAAGHEHSLILTGDRAVYQFGRIGSSYISTPTPVSGLGPSNGVPVVSLSAGKGYTIALSIDGEVWIWGTMGQGGAMGLGEKDGSKIKAARQPTRIDSLQGRAVVQAAAGWTHVLALANSKTSSCVDMAVSGEVRFGATSQRDYDDAKCEICHEEVGPRNGLLLFCDFCNKGFHLECHDPPLKAAPEGDWICFNCKLEGNSGESAHYLRRRAAKMWQSAVQLTLHLCPPRFPLRQFVWSVACKTTSMQRLFSVKLLTALTLDRATSSACPQMPVRRSCVTRAQVTTRPTLEKLSLVAVERPAFVA